MDTYDVFISYSHLDWHWVRDWLLPRRERTGSRVRIDFRACTDLRSGSRTVLRTYRLSLQVRTQLGQAIPEESRL
jgi:hypothetical protein